MTENGFTLIELLAVIVILAIIVLIATPIVLNIIKDTKKEADKRSVEMYANAVNNAIAEYQLKENKKVTKKEELEKYIKLNEENIDCEVKINKDGSIYVYSCEKDNKDINYEYGKLPIYVNGEIVYFDVVNGVGCTKEIYEQSWDEIKQDYLNSNTGYNGIKEENDTSNKNSCLKFYAFLDDGSDKINLLLDHNTIGNIRWSTDNYNTYGPTKSILLNNTNEWQGMEEPKLYNLDQTIQGSGVKYTVNYKDYKARLIEANDIAKITGADKLETINWKEQTAKTLFYFDGAKGIDSTWKTQVANSINKSEYHWLFDRTYNCINYGCNIEDSSTEGYWTSTSFANYNLNAWSVSFYGRINGQNVVSDKCGVRPVIEVLKTNLK